MLLLKIGADWCMGCLVMRPRLKQIEKENPQLKTKYYDFDKDTEVVRRYQLERGRLPAFIFLDKNGRELARLYGEPSKKKLLGMIARYQNS